MRFALDNSVVSGWYLDDQANEYTEAIAERLLDGQAVVPAIWELELANVLRKACLRRRLDARSAQAILLRIAELPIEVDRQPTPPIRAACAVAALRAEFVRRELPGTRTTSAGSGGSL